MQTGRRAQSPVDWTSSSAQSSVVTAPAWIACYAARGDGLGDYAGALDLLDPRLEPGQPAAYIQSVVGDGCETENAGPLPVVLACRGSRGHNTPMICSGGRTQ